MAEVADMALLADTSVSGRSHVRCCKRCNGGIPSSRRRDAVYCSPECSQQARREKWKALNPDKQRASEKAYREKNRETCNQRVRDFYANTPGARQRKREQEREWLARNRERANEVERNRRARKKETDPDGWYLEKKRAHLKSNYGLTLQAYDEMLAAQDFRCAICGTEAEKRFAFHVDHCHATGRVRGLLCKHCNPMLGLARENVNTLRAAIDYIERSA